MIKSLVFAAVTTVGALGAGNAQAGVSWSVNVNTPVVGTVISGGPGYHDDGYRHGYPHDDRDGYGRVYAPAPVYVPAPIYRVRPPVAYYPPAVVYRPVPVVYPRYYPVHRDGWRRHGGDRWDGHGRDHWDDHGRR